MFYFHPFFFKITDPCVGRSFSMCSHDLIFGTNNRVNGPLNIVRTPNACWADLRCDIEKENAKSNLNVCLSVIVIVFQVYDGYEMI